MAAILSCPQCFKSMLQNFSTLYIKDHRNYFFQWLFAVMVDELLLDFVLWMKTKGS